MKLLVLDQDVASAEEIGYIETSVGSIMGSKNQTFMAELKHDRSSGKRGQIIIRAESVEESNH